MAEKVINNKNWRSSVTVIEEMPDLNKVGKAGIRLKLDIMLMAHHGHPERDWRALEPEERQVLRQIARKRDPAWGISHQLAAIGALGQLRDKAALLQLSELARDHSADLRLRIAATYALGEIGGEQVQPVLRDLLNASAAEVRAQAIHGLVKNGSAADLAALELLATQDKTFARDIAVEGITTLRARLHLYEG